ncbi:hypothetical protein [Bordetella petrii]|uniref:Uncharacterized protein n=1 Tax=Bordetella petrii (strain ATCC BAA-461 / DSM 12804 / CCUG 43448 / CIP 107267 / Se-1111R) TaxID=340100 RepID=A9IJM7_BORPD|nr:hypothetical protein [Bordetella petrii]CAP42251.1 hypothetical protein predicted by Glimmer/Critica [Bordetella petrii]
MTIATLAPDSVATLSPSRLPAWLPRMLAQAASGVLRQPAKWPFSSGLSRGHLPGAVPQAQRPAQPAPASPATPAAGSRDTLAMDTQAAHSQSLGTAAQAVQQGVTARQMVVDILLVGMWGALIPGLMWLGAAAGF